VVLIVLLLVIGLPPAIIASSKGRNFALWYFYGMALFIAALPHAIVLKPKDASPVEPPRWRSRYIDGRLAGVRRATQDAPRHPEPLRRECPDCAEMIMASARVCRFCGWRREFAIAENRRKQMVADHVESDWGSEGWKLPQDADAAERMRRLDASLRWRGPKEVEAGPR